MRNVVSAPAARPAPAIVLSRSKDGRAHQPWFDPPNKSEGRQPHHAVGASRVV